MNGSAHSLPLNKRPIFVTGPARSGTSMVAGLLARHGIWTGTSKKSGAANPKGWYENDLFLMNTRDERGTGGPVPDSWETDWPELMKRDGWDGNQRWLVKAMPWAWKYLAPFDPVVVLCWRNWKRVLYSQERVGFPSSRQTLLENWSAMHDFKFRAAACVDVSTERVAAGDLTALDRDLPRIGVYLNHDIAEQWIEPEIWNRRK